MCTMFGDDERLRLGQIEHLPGAVAHTRVRIEARAAPRAGRRVMIDDVIGISDLPQGLAFVTFLPARLLGRTFPQARHPRRLLQSIARRRLAAVRTVQSELALKFGNPRLGGSKDPRGNARCGPKSLIRIAGSNERWHAARAFPRAVGYRPLTEGLVRSSCVCCQSFRAIGMGRS